LAASVVPGDEAALETYVGWKIAYRSIDFSQRDWEDVLHFIGDEHTWLEKTDGIEEHRVSA
jgi:hypothetical protein